MPSFLLSYAPSTSTLTSHQFDASHICIACGHSEGWVEKWKVFECIPEVNPCPICSPYPNAGYQQLSDDSEVPCFACNRREFEASVLKTSLIDGI